MEQFATGYLKTVGCTTTIDTPRPLIVGGEKGVNIQRFHTTTQSPDCSREANSDSHMKTEAQDPRRG